MAGWDFEIDAQEALPTRDELVAEALRKAILRGELSPGQKLDQNTIARHLNVSRSPVREALKTLAAEGLVDVQPHRTATVTELSLVGLQEIYDIRQVLEGLAARRAAPLLDDARIQRLELLLARLDAISTPSEWMDANNAFHTTIYEAAPRPRLLSMIAILRNTIGPYVRQYIATEDHLQVASHEHHAIVEACRARDGERAEAAVKVHIGTAAEFALDLRASRRGEERGL